MNHPGGLDKYISEFCHRFGISDLSISFDFEGFQFVRNYSETDASKQIEDKSFMLASMSKALTLMCVHKLFKRGVLDINEPIAEILPWLQGDAIAETRSTLDFLNHSSGMDHTVYQWGSTTNQSIETWLRSNYEQLEFSKPQGAYSYSNYNYQVCGAIIERVTGLSVPQAINNTVFSGRSVVFTKGDVVGTISSPSILEGGQKLAISLPNFVAHYDASSTMFSEASLLTNSLKNVVYGDTDFFDLFALCDAHLQESGVSYCPGYGYGLFKGRQGRLFGTISYGHGGKELGYNSLLFFSPQQKGVATILSNSHHVNIIELALTIYNALNPSPS